MNSNSTHRTRLILSARPSRRRWQAALTAMLAALTLAALWLMPPPARADGPVEFIEGWYDGVSDATTSVAWGDVDGDGDLDLAVGNGGYPGQVNRVYENVGPSAGSGWVFSEIPNALGSATDSATSVAWGDVDGDGDLDLAVGNLWQVNRVYENEGGGVFSEIADALGSAADGTESVAWGDMDGDGDLDLAVGNYDGVNRVYENVGPSAGLGWVFSEIANALGSATDATDSVAWGDLDGDGDLDLAVGNGSYLGQVNRVYENVGGGVFSEIANALGSATDDTRSVAWGDVDGDGDLDLAVGNDGQVNRLYRNPRQGLAPALPDNAPYIAVNQPYALAAANFYAISGYLSSSYIPITYTLFDPEGGPVGGVAATYSLNGGDNWMPAVATTGTVNTNLAASSLGVTHVYTWDTFASGFFGQSDNVVIRMVAYPQPSSSASTSAYHYPNITPGPYQQAYASAATFPFRVRGAQVRVYSETVHISNTVESALVYRLPGEQTTGGFPLADDSGSPFRTDQRGYLQGRGEIDLGDGLLALLPVHTALNYEGALELDGVDDYAIANPFHNAPITETTVSFWMRSEDATGEGTPFSYASPLADNTFLLTNYNDFTIHRGDGISVSTGISATDGLWHHIAVTWRSADGQVKLYKDGIAAYTGTLAAGSVISPDGSLMLGQDQNGADFFEGDLDEIHIWNVALTETQVLDDMFQPLNGGEAGLVASWPCDDSSQETASDQSANGNDLTLAGATWVGDYFGGYTVYHTSAAPTKAGLDMFTVSKPGVQVLTVTAEHPLLLFDLNVSLEWDARSDEQFTSQLEFDLERASEFLYDWSNGQAALGRVTVYHDRERWNDAHIRIYASNRLRPNADMGGLVSDVLTETVTLSDTKVITYAPGQIRMAATWNRFGDPGSNLGEDWSRTLAHELGHYVFFLDDNYLGFDAAGMFISVETCPGAMSDPYGDDDDSGYDEFHPDAGWLSGCQNTLSNLETGRSDWATIQAFYPGLNGVIANTGPNDLPLDVTRISFVDSISPSSSLDVPIFYLLKQEGGSYLTSERARAFLFQGDHLTDLGRPIRDQVNARGARPGERLCVFDLSAGRLGCDTIAPPREHLLLYDVSAWQPEVIVTPVTSLTVAISVTAKGAPASSTLRARLYPISDPAPKAITLTLAAPKVYSGTFNLAEPTFNAYVHVWVHGQDPPLETVSDYAMGGNPTGQRGRRTGQRGRRTGQRGRRTGQRGRRTGQRGRRAPVMSGDGQAILFGQDLKFQPGEFYTLQSATFVPEPPAWATVVGQAYRLTASSNAPDFGGTLLSITYQGDEVPPGEEGWLKMFYYDGSAWQPLTTTLNVAFNYASAPTQRKGLYALMSSLEIPLYGPGWDAFGYPVQGTRPVTDALRSIKGYYATVYRYDAGKAFYNRWDMYDVGVPGWVNDLHELEFGESYLISLTQAITLYLKGASDTTLAGANSLLNPPSTYYGQVIAGPSLVPSVGMTVTAWINDNLCGQDRTSKVDDQVVYSINVFADGLGDSAGCGTPERSVRFEVGSQVMTPIARWDNNQVREVVLSSGFRIYLPMVLKRQ